jgi:hypothetical protein
MRMRSWRTNVIGVSTARAIPMAGVRCLAPSVTFSTEPKAHGRGRQRSSWREPSAAATIPTISGGVQHYNDSHTHTEVLALIDAALILGETESLKPGNPPRAWKVVRDRWALVAALHPDAA